MGFILPLYQLILTQNYCSLDVYHASSIISRLQQWWICLWSQIWPAWPGGCTRSVGTHLGSSVSASEAWDRWCQPGLGPRAGQGSRDEQSLIYAAAPDRGPECRGLPLRSWPWLAAGSSIGRDREGGGGYDKWVSEKGWFVCLEGLASSFGPLGSCRICAACVEEESPVKHISFKPL